MRSKLKNKNLKFKIKVCYGLLVCFVLTLFTFHFSLFTTFAQSPCQQETANPRAEGLISALKFNISTKFGNPDKRCIVEQKAPFAAFKIPNYEQLKSLYYTQSKSTNKQPPLDDVPFVFSGDNIYLDNNNFTINPGSPVTGSGFQVIFIEDTLTINTNITYPTAGSQSKSGLVFIVKNNIVIDPSVTTVNAVLISSGTIKTAGSSCTTNSILNANQLTINGSLISLNSANPIQFCRSLANNNTPAENIIMDPKYQVLAKILIPQVLTITTENTDFAVTLPVQSPGTSAFYAICSASPGPANSGDNITWSAQKFNGIGPYTYAWTGDGITGTNTQESPQITYTATQTTTKRVSVTITDTGTNPNQTTSASCSVLVNSPTLAASCSGTPNPVNIGEQATWTANITTPGVGPYTYSWSGTDGLTGSSSSVNKTYTDAASTTKSATVAVYDTVTGKTSTPSCSITLKPLTLKITPTTANPGQTMKVSWENILNPTTTDWIGLYKTGTADTTYMIKIYTNSCSSTNNPSILKPSGSCFLTFPVTAPPGTYETRYFTNDTFTKIATSNTFTSSNGVYDLGDLSWNEVSNGYGKAEKDTSNGESRLGDGKTISLGKTGTSQSSPYSKGLGVHPTNATTDSEITYDLTQGGVPKCSTFTADIGIDDEVESNPSCTSGKSARFLVLGDATQLYDSGIMTDSSATKTVNVDLTNKSQLQLKVTSNGDDGFCDHADWASPKLTCTGTPTAHSLTVTESSVVPGASVTVNWANLLNTEIYDYIAIYPKGANPKSKEVDWIYSKTCSKTLPTLAAASSGSCLLPIPINLAKGDYVLRYYRDDGTNNDTGAGIYNYAPIVASNSFTVNSSLSASPIVEAEGNSITVTWSGINGPNRYDIIAIYAQGETNEDNYLGCIYANAGGLCTGSNANSVPPSSGSQSFQLPTSLSDGGVYEFHYDKSTAPQTTGHTNTQFAKSNTITSYEASCTLVTSGSPTYSNPSAPNGAQAFTLTYSWGGQPRTQAGTFYPTGSGTTVSHTASPPSSTPSYSSYAPGSYTAAWTASNGAATTCNSNPFQIPSTLIQDTSYKRIFASVEVFKGDLINTQNGYPGGANGLAGADAKCQYAADNKGLGKMADGTSVVWKAWLSDSATSASSRLDHSSIPYKKLDGIQIASNWTDLTDGTLASAINISENNSTTPNPKNWTNTTAGGAISTESCSNWTSSSLRGIIGKTSDVTSTWTNNVDEGCGNNRGLYCVQQ